MELISHLPIERQARVIGGSWLNQQLIGDEKRLGNLGFGGEVKNTLLRQADFLAERRRQNSSPTDSYNTMLG